MPYKKLVTVLVLLIALLAMSATVAGIFYGDGPGGYKHTSIRGKEVSIYGKGLYKHMSAEVAPQGIAQDYVTLFIAIPLLLISVYRAGKGSVKGRFLLTGVLGYFLVTYLFYLVMGMYNAFFIVYVCLAGASFYSFLIMLLSFRHETLPGYFREQTPVKSTARFLIVNSFAIALLWLGIVLPPLFDGTIIPVQVEHYTTLIVQGLDLAILLPAAVISAVLFLRRKPLGYLLCPVYFVFLSLLMTALTAKVLAMFLLGFNVIPVIFLILTLNLVTLLCTVAIFRGMANQPSVQEG